MKFLLMLITTSSTICSTIKQMAPNSWNVTFYEPTTGHQNEGQIIGVGVSGALPFGKQ
jgi:hypothetical protein